MSASNIVDYDDRSALIIVDLQNDFAHPEGSLFVPGGDRIVPGINTEIITSRGAGAAVVLTQDWHPPTTPHFATDGGVWPVHCVAGTWGSQLVKDLDPAEAASVIIRKGTNGEDGYSAFAMREPGGDVDIPTGLTGLLRERGVSRVMICGLATDICVSATALSARHAGFDTTVIWDLTRPVFDDDQTMTSVLTDFKTAGVVTIGGPD